MVGSKCGALRGDNVLKASHETCDQIQLPFANDGIFGVQQGAFRLIEAEKHFALCEDGRFRRIDVFGSFFVTRQNASAETDGASLFVANGKHEAAAKAIVIVFGSFFADDQAGFFNGRKLMPFGFGPIDRVIPKVGGVTKAEELHGFGGDATAREVITSNLAGGLIGQRGLPTLGDLLMNLEELFLYLTGLLVARAAFQLQRYFCTIGQAAESFDKVDALVFHHEFEDVSAFVTAEAMEDLALGVDVETGALFLMKRTQGSKVGAGPF